MRKIINFIIQDAEGVICLFGNEDRQVGYNEDVASFYVPRYIVIGIFDNGTVEVGGITSLEDLAYDPSYCSLTDYYNDVFTFKQLCYDVRLDLAKAFVAWAMAEDIHVSEDKAKAIVLGELKASGVKVSWDALAYLQFDRKIRKFAV